MFCAVFIYDYSYAAMQALITSDLPFRAYSSPLSPESLTAVKHAGIWQMNTRQCAWISSAGDITAAAAAVVWISRY